MTDHRVGAGLSIRIAGLGLALVLLAGCDEMPSQLAFLQPGDRDANEVSSAAAPAATTLIERDVEAPEVFQVTEAGLWDGRPSLGGVWVAHPDVSEPERVIIRNAANGKFVIGALFRRERDIPGPRVQTSSDAAAALGMLAGSPVQLNVTALRREAVEEAQEPETVDHVETAEEITEQTLDPIAAAGAALDQETVATAAAVSATGATLASAATSSAAPAAPAPQPAPSRSSLGKPYIQIGIFSVEANANRTADMMRGAGMVPTVFAQTANGKPFWRVVVGPARTSSERATLLNTVKGVGFSDAYAVSN
ncbi:SPOR domain-containing protein [Aestuariivita sp.]|jgi:cell division septation protein DedD|uniref:SPOR domain-containing protein n=1 Tax=Aestuariivita sp. TaxID=1872407 RepID=UPI00216FAB03|nr:SPOR domain-containing protein [Aestuariivita sp.]MCE8007472.1 SPOR domain-containing protein [Aestuariivita sp.]